MQPFGQTDNWSAVQYLELHSRRLRQSDADRHLLSAHE